MSFILRIYVMGLMAFVPNTNGNEMTVLLIDARPGYHTTDGSFFPPHFPVLLASAGGCKGDCLTDAQEAANHLFGTGRRPDPEESLRQLKAGIQGGGVWILDGHHLSVEPGIRRALAAAPAPSLELVTGRRQTARAAAGPGPVERIPGNLQESEDFSWVAEMPRIVPEAGEVDPDVLAPIPVKGLVVGRLKLSVGKVKAYRMIAHKGKVPSFMFQPLRSQQPTTDYSQALSDTVVVEIPVEGCEVTLAAKKFGTEETRTMTLSPAECGGADVEMFLLNLPDPSWKGEHEEHDREPQSVGTHFELYYELSKMRPSWRQRAVPHASPGGIPVESIDPPSSFTSSMGIPRWGTYSHPICPQVAFSASPDA